MEIEKIYFSGIGTYTSHNIKFSFLYDKLKLKINKSTLLHKLYWKV